MVAQNPAKAKNLYNPSSNNQDYANNNNNNNNNHEGLFDNPNKARSNTAGGQRPAPNSKLPPQKPMGLFNDNKANIPIGGKYYEWQLLEYNRWGSFYR